ncbi:hypothetical protein N2152v2_000436 [Parachlorella kessleri]
MLIATSTPGRPKAADRSRGGRRQGRQNRDFISPRASNHHHDRNLAISVRDVHLSFKGQGVSKQVLQGIELAIPRGTFHMLLGPNGCGKSTLLRVLAGLFRPDAGSIHVARPHAFVFQNPDHQVVMPTVEADVAFGLGRYKLDEAAVQAAVRHALEQVGLAGLAERPTSSLSGGQKQRVAIAGALAESPSVLLMDELTTFLDYEDQLNVIQCVRSIVDGSSAPSSTNGSSPSSYGNGSASSSSSSSLATGSGGATSSQQHGGGVTALWVTHRLEELEYADYVSYMDDGQIAFSGTPQQMKAYLRKLGARV